MNMLESLTRALGYDTNRSWVDFGKSLVPGSEKNTEGNKAATKAFNTFRSLFLESQRTPAKDFFNRPINTIIPDENGGNSDTQATFNLTPIGLLFQALFPKPFSVSAE